MTRARPVPDALTPYVPRPALGRAADGPQVWTVDGTLVFADISGFTRLTEKLSQHGKAGAEEIVTTITRVFTALLDAADADAEVLKFSGDALLLLYDGPDHQWRAVHAALSMRRALRRAGGVDTSRGRVRLRMSVGIQSGPVTLMLCGGDHLELHVLGPVATATTALEAGAGPGQVLVGRRTVAAIGRVRVGAGVGDATLVHAVPAPPAGPPRPAPDGADPTSLVPPPLRAMLRAGIDEHEHRRATVAFAHFRGVDALLAAGRPDEAFQRVQHLTTTTMSALAEFDVLLTATDIGADGGKLMMTAGAPTATGDEEARMLLVARRLVDEDTGLSIRVGVHTGNVFVGSVGAAHRRTYSTMGATTNLAARVLGRAEDGEVLATAAVLETTARRFRLGTPRALRLRGVRDQVTATPVTGHTVAPAATTDDHVPLVGREAELALVEERLAAARGGEGAVVEVVAGAGHGKSRFARCVVQRAEGMATIAVAGDPYRRATPYHAAGQVLRQALGVAASAPDAEVAAALDTAVMAHRPALADLRPLLAAVLGTRRPETGASAAIDERFRRRRTQQAAVELLVAVLDHPALLVLEDAGTMDDASAELLASLLARAPAHGWLALVTREDERCGLHAGRGYDATVMALDPLTEAQAAALVDAMAERTPLPVHRRRDIVERAQGNPMFLVALVEGHDAGGELPRSVEATIAARIDALPAAARRRLRHAAVLGDRFPASLLDVAFGDLGLCATDPEWDDLAPLVERHGDGFAFRSQLVRQVAYEGLAYHLRRDLHGRVADALSRDAGDAALLAQHLARAGRWRRAWEAARIAAAQALGDGANAVAGELYDLALTAAGRLDGLDPGTVVETALAGSRAWRHSGIHERALGACAVAARAATTRRERLEVALQRAAVHQRAGAYTQALRGHGRVLAEAGELPESERTAFVARAHTGYAACRLAQGRPDEAADHARAAVGAAEAAGDDRAVAMAHQLLARCHDERGETTEAARCRDLALPRFAAAGDLAAQGTVLYDLARDAQHRGQLEVALWMLSQSRRVRERAGDVDRAAATLNAIGEVQVALGDPEAAGESFAEALRTWRGAGSPHGTAEASANLAELALVRGDLGTASRLAEEALDLATSIGADDLLPRLLVARGEVLQARGRDVEAWEAASAALDGHAGLAPALAGRAHLVRAAALQRSGSPDRAESERDLARATTTTATTQGDDPR